MRSWWGVRDWPPWIPPLAVSLWLVWTSLAEPFPDLGIWDGKRYLQLWLWPLLMAASLLSSAMREQVAAALQALGHPALIAWLSFLSLGVLSSLRLAHPGYPLADVGLLFMMSLGALAIAASRQTLDKRFERTVLGLLALLGVGIYCLEWVAVSVYLKSDAQYAYMESLLRFGHPRMYNQVQTWTLPLLALLPGLFPNRRWLRWLAPVLIGLQWQIILTTAARGTVVSLVAAMSLMALLAPGTRWGWLRTQLLGLVTGVLLYIALAMLLHLSQPQMEQFVAQSAGREFTGTSGRDYLWQLAIDDAKARPVLGAGPAMFACDSPYAIAGSPHSFPLQILGEWGVPAFLLLGALVCAMLYRLLRHTHMTGRARPTRKSLVRTCLTISILAACVHSLVSGVFVAPASQVAGMLVLGWFWGLHPAIAYPAEAPAKSPKIGLALMLAGLLIAAHLITFARAELQVLPQRTAYALDYGVAAPRFWSDGRVCLYQYGPDG